MTPAPDGVRCSFLFSHRYTDGDEVPTCGAAKNVFLINYQPNKIVGIFFIVVKAVKLGFLYHEFMFWH